jgi:hypothetical protein
MVDRKPPRLATDALETLVALLDYQRGSLVRKVEGLTEAQAGWSPVPSGTSPRWLVGHMADAEQTWVVRRFAGREVTLPGGATTGVSDDLATCVAAYRVEETARHAGHADILRELLDGATGR